VEVIKVRIKDRFFEHQAKLVKGERVGEIRRGREIGYFSDPGNNYVWQVCENCQRGFWRRVNRVAISSNLCPPCVWDNQKKPQGANAISWKGGRLINDKGYVLIYIQPGDFFFPMAHPKGKSKVAGYVLEHRLVVAKALGRCLLPWEVVHHKGTKYPMGSKENKQDNRYPENLGLLPTRKYHLVDSVTKSYVKLLERKIKKLEKELECKLMMQA